MSGSTTTTTTPATPAVTPAPTPTQEAIGSPSVINDGPVTNPATPNVIEGATSDADTKPDYTLDESTSIEKADGSSTTVGDALTDIDNLKTKTSDLSADGSSYSGAVTGDVSKGQTGSDTLKTVADVVTAVNTATTKTSKLSADGSKFTGDVSGATGLPTGVTPQPAPAALTAAPTEADFNGLVTLLKTAGVLK